MSERTQTEQGADLELEYDLDAPREKVWRAISIPEFRNKWLPGSELMDPQPVSFEPDEEISYRMKDNEPPFLESEVTFRVCPNEIGGTRLRIIHRLVEARSVQRRLKAANSNGPALMRAA